MNQQNQTNTNATPQTAEPKVFSTIDAILPHGIFILAGSPKVGKSWLTLDMCHAISTGGKLWDFAATPGAVLYLALEVKHNRLEHGDSPRVPDNWHKEVTNHDANKHTYG